MPDRRVTRRHLVFWLLATVAVASHTDAGPLPRIAVSLPASVSPANIARAVQACGTGDVLIVLPPTLARIGTAATGGTPVPQSGVPVPQGNAPVPQSHVSLPQGGARVYLHLTLDIGEVPGAGRERETLIERQASDIIGGLGLDRPGVAGLVLDATGTGAADELVQFTLATVAVKAKALKPGLHVALALTADAVARGGEALSRLIAYADSLVVPSSSLAGDNRESVIGGLAAGRPVILKTQGGDDARGAASAFLDLLMTPGARVAETIWIEVPTLAALGALCTSVQVLSRTLGDGFEMTAPERASAAVVADGRPVSPSVAFVGSRTADVAVLLRSGGTPDSPRPLSLAAASGESPQVTCLGALDGRRLEVRGAGAQAACRADTDYVLVVARAGAQTDRVFETVSVTGRASIRVEEIIARWQASREAERRALDSYSVPCLLSLHFETTSLAATFDVALEMEQFVDRSGTQDWVQTGFLLNGVRLGRGREFPLPQIEPEKVVTKPLELRLHEPYAYELLGTETVNGHVCYVVGIRPARPDDTLYSGQVWIDGADFRQVRLRLEQRDGKNNVASHVETQEFEGTTDAQKRVFTLVRAINAEDAVNLGGRTVTLEKRYRFGEYAINAPDFAARLAAVRATDAPMFRDTDQGLRALRKKGDERVVEPVGGKQVRALVTGVLYGGSYSFPIPLAGLSWVDFDFRKTGMQLSTLFAGPLLVANLSRQENKSLRWGVDLSLSGLPWTSYAYAGDRELTDRRLMSFEQFFGGLINWQATPELTLSAQAHVYWNYYRATGETDPGYRVPATSFRAEVYGEAKYVRRGFTGMATIDQTRRLGWREFGFPDAPAPTSASFTRYSFEVSQHLYAGKLTRGGVSAAYYDGRNLDRFSRYSPSFLQRPRIKGIPAGVDTFDQITMLGGYYGFNVMDVAKLEAAYGHSWTRNKEEGGRVRQFDGVDVGIGLAGPFGTFVQGSISVAIRGNLARYNTRWGTYLLFLRPLKK
jgi:hypothetical protein